MTPASGSDAAGTDTEGTDRAIWLALVVALVVLLQPGSPPRIVVLALIIIAATLAVSLRWRIGGAAVVALLVVGIALRLAPPSGFSDVLVVTEAAIREMLAGGNPYGHGYAESVPPGAPYAYGPLALLWYLPSLSEPGRIELLASLVVLVLLAVRGRALGLAVYATTPALVVAATDGANDTSAGLLILLALLAAVRVPLAGAALLAVATAFKPYALAWLPGLLGFAATAGIGAVVGPLLAFLATSALVWLPAAVAWGPGALAWSFREADRLHDTPYYSLAYGLRLQEGIPKEAWTVLRVGAGALLAVVSFAVSRSAGAFIVSGALVFAATLFLGWWSTFAYLAAVAPILCWHLDDWLGLAGSRVVWPGDPVRRVTEWADRRWPVRPDARSVTHL